MESLSDGQDLALSALVYSLNLPELVGAFKPGERSLNVKQLLQQY